MSLDVVGKLARVTAEITSGHLGEVMIEVRQGTERFLARGADKDATIPSSKSKVSLLPMPVRPRTR